ncbi:MAG: glycosyltransferase family 2 protein [Candidatus Aureabacteria bacterium]|nr:glycosyltransferase family 2 protein [Candidatus Auribacterota bacterium]
MDFSVVIPFYNEEENISFLIQEIIKSCTAVSEEYEIIAVDDGSLDNTFIKLKNEKNESSKLRIISLEKRSGQSAALWAGIHNSTSDIIVMMDGDGQNDPIDIPRMLELIKKNDAVFGWRKKRNDPFIKRISSKIANSVRIFILGVDVHDTGCGLKVIKKHLLLDLFPFKGIHRFFPSLLKMKNTKFIETEVNHRPRKKGKTKYNVTNRVFTAFSDLIAVKWMQKKKICYKVKEIL